MSYHNSFIAIETYICMTSMMMLDITMEVYVNKSLPKKMQAPSLAWALFLLGHFWKLLDTLWYLRYFGIDFGKLYSFGLWAKFIRIQNNLLDRCLI